LAKQDYPLAFIEFILVDDFSEDRTFQLLKNSTIDVRVLRSDKEGKKFAIKKGVLHAKHDFILTTDADCRFSSDWINSMISPFLQNDIYLVSGPVAYANLQNTFDKLQALEFMSLIGSGAGAIGVEKAFMCNGANMAFRKSIFSSVNEYIASGDDVFLLHHVKSNGGKIAFVKERAAIVFTNAKPSIKTFINQRNRWAAKSSSYTDKTAQWIAIVVFLTNFIPLILLFFSEYHQLALFFTIKVIIDYCFISSLSRFFFYQKYLPYFWLMILFYPFYIVWVALISQLSVFEWKGRKYQK